MLNKIQSVKTLNIVALILMCVNTFILFIGLFTVLSVIGLVFISIFAILSIVAFVLQIIVLVKLSNIKTKYPEYLDTPWVLLLIGMFVPLVLFVGSIMLCSKIKIVEAKAAETENDDNSTELE